MTPDVVAALERTLSASVVENTRVGGGDINDAYQVDLSDRRRVFVKVNPKTPPRMFETEASGLDWLRSANAISIPRVLGEGMVGNTGYLALEWIEGGRPRPGFDEQLGQQLAALHRHGTDGFGLDRDNYIGRLAQANRRSPCFREFLAERRLVPQFELARRAGHFDTRTSTQFECLIGRLGMFLGDEEPPARLHGDLWSGNVLAGLDGKPWLIDPAVYGGHREIDLAMMRLFGGFSERVFQAYGESFPLGCGHRERVGLMQLYPLLVHVNLFGGSYVAEVSRIIDEYVG